MYIRNVIKIACAKQKVLGVSEDPDLACTIFLTRSNGFHKGPDRFREGNEHFHDKFSRIFNFVVVFDELVLEAQTELDKVLGY